MNSSRRTARITGVLYLIIIICAGFSEGFVRSSIIVPGNAAVTADNIVNSEWLFRVGFVSDLVAFLCDAAVSILLYVLLRPVSKTLSLLAASFRLLAHPAIASINLLNHFIGLSLLSSAGYLKVFEAAQLQALVLLFLNMHNIGYLIAGAFFGVHCFILGYLLYKSDLFPGTLGILMIIASIGYLTESFGNFLVPGHENILQWIVGLSAGIGELSLTFWLLIKGVKNPKQPAIVKN
jgi:hypothetical protein